MKGEILIMGDEGILVFEDGSYLILPREIYNRVVPSRVERRHLDDARQANQDACACRIFKAVIEAAKNNTICNVWNGEVDKDVDRISACYTVNNNFSSSIFVKMVTRNALLSEFNIMQINVNLMPSDLRDTKELHCRVPPYGESFEYDIDGFNEFLGRIVKIVSEFQIHYYLL